MRDIEREFSPDLRDLVKKEQGNLCALCGRRCTNHELQVHHKIPISRGGGAERENAVALCRKPRICHEIFDQLALNYAIFYDDIAMEIGREYMIGIRTETLTHERTSYHSSGNKTRNKRRNSKTHAYNENASRFFRMGNSPR